MHNLSKIQESLSGGINRSLLTHFKEGVENQVANTVKLLQSVMAMAASLNKRKGGLKGHVREGTQVPTVFF